MAIQVICPGCMSRFEVSDRFAGKKGPCPKCSNLIEIPKEKLVIHAPDEIIVEGRRVKNPDFIRPIEREAFVFTTKQVWINVVGVVVILIFAWLFSFLGSGPMKWMAGTSGIFVVAFVLAKNGYILVRDPDDLEIFLGGELHRKSFLVATGYTLSWIIFEALLLYLNPGFFFFAYLLPIALLASFVPLVVFDTDYGDSFMLYFIFVLCVLVIRGIMFAPDGWIWKPIPLRVRQSTIHEIPGGESLDDLLTDEPESPRQTPKLDKKAPNPEEAIKK